MGMKLKYAVIGAGAIGGYYGGRLAHSGNEVHFLFHSEYDHVKKNGLRVDSVVGDFLVQPINAYSATADMPKCDVVIVALKSTQNHLLPDMLRPILHDGTVVVLIQNGLGLEEELAQQFPNLTIAGGMAFICSSRVGVGHISHQDYGPLTVGFYQHPKQEVLLQMKADFENAQVPFNIAEDLNVARWKKLVWNIPYNGLTVALNTSTDVIMRTSSSRQLVTDMMEEVLAGAEVCGAKIDHSFIDDMLSMTDKMTPYSPSMKLDFDNKRQMEIRAIYSNPIRIAKASGFYMRKVEMLEQQLLFIQERMRG